MASNTSFECNDGDKLQLVKEVRGLHERVTILEQHNRPVSSICTNHNTEDETLRIQSTVSLNDGTASDLDNILEKGREKDAIWENVPSSSTAASSCQLSETKLSTCDGPSPPTSLLADSSFAEGNCMEADKEKTHQSARHKDNAEDSRPRDILSGDGNSTKQSRNGENLGKALLSIPLEAQPPSPANVRHTREVTVEQSEFSSDQTAASGGGSLTLPLFSSVNQRPGIAQSPREESQRRGTNTFAGTRRKQNGNLPSDQHDERLALPQPLPGNSWAIGRKKKRPDLPDMPGESSCGSQKQSAVGNPTYATNVNDKEEKTAAFQQYCKLKTSTPCAEDLETSANDLLKRMSRLDRVKDLQQFVNAQKQQLKHLEYRKELEELYQCLLEARFDGQLVWTIRNMWRLVYDAKYSRNPADHALYSPVFYLYQNVYRSVSYLEFCFQSHQ